VVAVFAARMILVRKSLAVEERTGWQTKDDRCESKVMVTRGTVTDA
jgi:hypothetical protein